MTQTIQQTEAKRLLIVEDSADYRALLTKLFKKNGYVVDCASNGQEALAHLAGDTPLPNLILLDLMMPVMDGFEFREKQNQESRLAKIPTILMTAHGDLQSARDRLGLLDYVRKPVEMADLLSLVSRATTVST